MVNKSKGGVWKSKEKFKKSKIIRQSIKCNIRQIVKYIQLDTYGINVYIKY